VLKSTLTLYFRSANNVKSSFVHPRTLQTTSKLGAATLFVLLGLSGCKFVGTDYVAPELEVPDQWQQRLVRGNAAASLGVDKWWMHFNDPTLDRVVERAVEANKDLAIAYERVLQARAARQISKSGLYPSVDGTGHLSRVRTSENVGAGTAGGNTETYYGAGAGVTWELDVLGGVRRSIEAADAGLQATEETYRDFMVLLLAEVAGGYVEVRTLDERILLAQENIRTQKGSLKLAEDRFEAGLVPKIDITQAQTNLSNTQAFLPQLGIERVEVINRLSVLLGGYSYETQALLGSSSSIPKPPQQAAAATPAEVLRSRPDVRAAERRLASQHARVGVAEADLYPRFTLNGNFQLLSTESGDVFDSSSRDYGFGPAFRWNLFNAGRVRSQIDIEESKTREAYLAYENVVLSAVGEVETSMGGLAFERDRLASLMTASASASETVSLVKDNYAKGLVDFQNVLDAERTATSTDDKRALSEGRIAGFYIELYQSLGGGFPEEEMLLK
jgi:multidrug efflux system outer membrane protein